MYFLDNIFVYSALAFPSQPRQDIRNEFLLFAAFKFKQKHNWDMDTVGGVPSVGDLHSNGQKQMA